jgi:hypothetical protein
MDSPATTAMCTALRCSTTIPSSRTRSQSGKLSTDLIESLLPRLIRCYRSSGVGLPVPPKQTIGTMNRVNFLSQSGKPRSLDYIGLHARYSWSKMHSTTVTAVTIPENHLWIFPHWNARCRCRSVLRLPRPCWILRRNGCRAGYLPKSLALSESSLEPDATAER